jgi:hypothetical protein
MFGVLGALDRPDSPNLPVVELIEEVLLVDRFSMSRLRSLAVREGLMLNIIGRLTLKIESVGMLGVDSSKPP